VTERVDLLILGAGCAGLGLAARLAPSAARVLVLEPRLAYTNDRTWCFWAPVQHALSHLVSRRWTRWHIGVDDGQPAHPHASEALPYQCIPAERYYAWALERCAANPTLTLALGVTASTVRRDAAGFQVETSAGRVHARLIVDTRPDAATAARAPLLEQVFVGCEIRPRVGCDTHSAGVMERLRCDGHGVLFDYVLPLGEDRVLVEVTRFAVPGLELSVLQADLDAALAHRGWSDAPVLRRETGRLPMGLPNLRAPASTWVRAGTVGGSLRAATGYGFRRTQAWAQQCSERYRREGSVMAHPAEPGWRHWMDLTFLRALRRQPALGPQMFARMAAALGGEGFARFMTDSAGFDDWRRVVAALPPAPLLRAAVRW
jgi:lycopene beta-cyclase